MPRLNTVSRSASLSIGELSRRTGVNIETIRYYERIGLLPAPPRSQGRHRLYDELHRQRLVFIRRSRALGFSIKTHGNFWVSLAATTSAAPRSRLWLSNTLPTFEQKSAT